MSDQATPSLRPLGPNADRVRALYEQGFQARAIARALDLSTSRVYQILDALERRGLIRRAAS